MVLRCLSQSPNSHELNNKTNTELKERTTNCGTLEEKFKKTILTATNFLQTTGGSQGTKPAVGSYATAQNKTRSVEKLNRKRSLSLSLSTVAPFGECGNGTHENCLMTSSARHAFLLAAAQRGVSSQWIVL